MNAYEMFETDAKLEQEGIVLDYGSFRIRVAHAGGTNKKFQNLLNARLKPYERLISVNNMDDDVFLGILREVYAETIVLDMEVRDESEQTKTPVYVKGVPTKGSTPAPFTVKEVVRLFTDLPKLFIDVKKGAEDFSLFKSVQQEEAIKN